jgi:hypothetical protein
MLHFIVSGSSLLLKVDLTHPVDMKLTLLTTEGWRALLKEAAENGKSIREMVIEQIANVFPTTVHLADDVDEDILGKNAFQYSLKDFLSVIRNISHDANCVVKMCNRGVVGIALETAYAEYNYYLRGDDRSKSYNMRPGSGCDRKVRSPEPSIKIYLFR